MKITLEKEQRIFFTSDTHFSHENICEGTTRWDKTRRYRPYNLIEDMNKALVANINKTVGEDDILFHLGDWSFGGKSQIYEFRKQINCKNIHLVFGNHDHHIENNKQVEGIFINDDNEIEEGDEVENFYEEYKFGMTWDNRIFMEHLFTSVSSLRNLTVSIPQGKSSKTANQPKNKKHRFVLCHYPIASWKDMSQGVMHLHGHIHTPDEHKVGPGRMMDVGIDGHPEFRPYELNEVLDLIKDRPIKGLLTHKFDHHG